MVKRCGWCQNPFEWTQRPLAESFPLRSVLRIPDAAPDTVICDNCYQSVIGTHNPHPESIPNPCLREFVK